MEIDGELHDIGRRYFGLRDRPELRLFAEDARPFLRRTEARYDAIFVDAYRQPYIPFYLTTREFFTLARERLAPGGVLIVNAGPSRGLGGARARALGVRRVGLPERGARPDRAHQHAAGRLYAPRHRERLLAAAEGLPDDLRPLAAAAPAGWRPACAAARSTPTTGRRWSG